MNMEVPGCFKHPGTQLKIKEYHRYYHLKGGISCQEEMERVPPDRDQEQEEGLEWEGAVVEEAVWTATDLALVPVVTVYVQNAVRK